MCHFKRLTFLCVSLMNYILCYSCISSSGMSADMKLSTGTEDVVEKTDRKEQNV